MTPPERGDPEGRGFLSRWSRLKQEAAKPAAEPPAPETAPQPPPEGDALKALIDQLPKIEDIVPGQDLSAFMQAWVPQDLRNAALRRMWSLDPAIKDFVSEALDYAYDYNAPGGAPGYGPITAGLDLVREAHALLDRGLGLMEPASESTLRPQDVPTLAAIKTQEENVNKNEEKANSNQAPQIDVTNAETHDVPARELSIVVDQKSKVRRHGGAIPT